METRVQSERYGVVAIAFHWLTAALVSAAYILSEGGPESRIYSAELDTARRIHETLGLALFAVVAVRIVWRWFDRQPAVDKGPKWMSSVSQLVHLGLYFLLLAIPLTAIAGTWLLGHPVTPVGLDLTPWLSENRSLGELVMDVHTTLGDVIVWVAGGHAAAALFHHFYLRDRVLRSMLPGRAERGS